jgi:hypothetical protein
MCPGMRNELKISFVDDIPPKRAESRKMPNCEVIHVAIFIALSLLSPFLGFLGLIVW